MNTSILIPTCNRAARLERVLNKISHLENIIVCINNTNKIETSKYNLLKSKFKNVHFISSKPGVIAARNKLIEYANTEFIWFLDDDDMPTNDFLESINNNFDCNVDVHTFKIKATRFLGNKIVIKKANLSRYFAKKSCPQLSTMVIKTSIAKKFIFHEKIIISEDLVFQRFLSSTTNNIKKWNQISITYNTNTANSITGSKVSIEMWPFEIFKEVLTSNNIDKRNIKIALKIYRNGAIAKIRSEYEKAESKQLRLEIEDVYKELGFRFLWNNLFWSKVYLLFNSKKLK